MNRSVPLLMLAFFVVLGCSRSVVAPPAPPVVPPVVPPPVDKEYWSTNNYDAGYSGRDGNIFYNLAYHIRDTLYDYYKGIYYWTSFSRNASDTFYQASGQSSDPLVQNKSCTALISAIDSSQQKNYDYYIGSYFKFCLFNDTTAGNVQFMIPADSLSSADSIPVGSYLFYRGGLNSYYRNLTKVEVKIVSGKDFVRVGDSLSFANPLFPAIGTIDSVEVGVLIKRFSDNGIHPNPQVTKTVDGSYHLYVHFVDGTYMSIINAEFYNLYFQKQPM